MRRLRPLAAVLLAAVASGLGVPTSPPRTGRRGRARSSSSRARRRPSSSSDLARGEGLRARRGDTLYVHYAMTTWSDGREKDSSYDRRRVFEFVLGTGQVITGWDRGLVGMRTGGRRRLILPPAFAYGDEGSPPAVGPRETLVFVVDLVRVCRGRGRSRRCG